VGATWLTRVPPSEGWGRVAEPDTGTEPPITYGRRSVSSRRATARTVRAPLPSEAPALPSRRWPVPTILEPAGTPTPRTRSLHARLRRAPSRRRDRLLHRPVRPPRCRIAGGRPGDRAGRRRAAPARADRERHAGGVRVRRRPVDRGAERGPSPAAHLDAGHRDRPPFLPRREVGGVHLEPDREPPGMGRLLRGRGAPAAHVAPVALLRARLDAGRRGGAVRLGPRLRSRALRAPVAGPRRGRPAARGAGGHGLPRLLLARRRPAGGRPRGPVGHGVQELPRRPEHAAHHPGPEDARRDEAPQRPHHRHVAGVAGRPDLVPLRPRLHDQRVVLRSGHQGARPGHPLHGRGRQDAGRRGEGRARLRGGWLDLAPGPGHREGPQAGHHRARGLPVGHAALGGREPGDRVRLALAHREAGPVRGPRRHLHGAGRARRRPRPDALAGRRRPLAHVVPGRRAGGLVLGLGERLPAAGRRPGGAGEAARAPARRGDEVRLVRDMVTGRKAHGVGGPARPHPRARCRDREADHGRHGRHDPEPGRPRPHLVPRL
jgi:hypothetical protein